MDKRVLAMCILVGSTVGGYLPTFVGQGQFSIASILGGVVGGIAGVWLAARISESLY